jgi:hypothetical protein
VPAHANSCLAPVPPNLVRNNNFECDGINSSKLIKPITGWTAIGTSIGETSSFDPVLAGPSGFLAIGTVGKLGVVSQTLQTKIGQKYLFSFAFSSDGTPGNIFEAKWGTEIIFSAIGLAARSGWAAEDATVNYGFYVVATTTTTKISFSGEAGKSGAFVGIDYVIVQPAS